MTNFGIVMGMGVTWAKGQIRGRRGVLGLLAIRPFRRLMLCRLLRVGILMFRIIWNSYAKTTMTI